MKLNKSWSFSVFTWCVFACARRSFIIIIVVVVVDFLYNTTFFSNFIYDHSCPARFPIIIYSRKMPLLRGRRHSCSIYNIIYLRDRSNNMIYYNNNEMISLRSKRRTRILCPGKRRISFFFSRWRRHFCCVMTKVFIYIYDYFVCIRFHIVIDASKYCTIVGFHRIVSSILYWSPIFQCDSVDIIMSTTVK